MLRGSVFEGAEFAPSYMFKKFDQNHPHGEQTGTILHINTAKYPICVIDIDFKLIPENRRKELRPIILDLIPEDCIVVQTAHGGFHIYCSFNHSPKRNRYVGIVETPDFSVDLFFASHPDKKSNVVFPGSRVKDSNDGPELTYHFVRGNENTSSLHDVEGVIGALCAEFPLKPMVSFLEGIRNNEKSPSGKRTTVIPLFVNSTLIDALVNGMAGIVISRSGLVPISNVFQSINSLIEIHEITEEMIGLYYEKIRKISCFEDEELYGEWDKIKEAEKNNKSSWSVLMKIVSAHNPQYYRTNVGYLTVMKK